MHSERFLSHSWDSHPVCYYTATETMDYFKTYMFPWFFIEINSSLESAVTRDGVLGFFIIRFSFKKLYAAAESAFFHQLAQYLEYIESLIA